MVAPGSNEPIHSKSSSFGWSSHDAQCNGVMMCGAVILSSGIGIVQLDIVSTWTHRLMKDTSLMQKDLVIKLDSYPIRTNNICARIKRYHLFVRQIFYGSRVTYQRLVGVEWIVFLYVSIW